MKLILSLCLAFIQFLFSSSCLAAGTTADAEPHILVAYFSLGHNAEYAEDVDVTTSASIAMKDGQRFGTTEIIADQVLARLGGDKFLIQTKEPYPTDFQAVIDQNHEEASQQILPELSSAVENIEQYDVIFLGYPIWNMTAPQAIRSFLASYDFSGKTIVPFCTHDGYGSGNSYSDIASAAPNADVVQGIAIEATDILNAEAAVDAWLGELGFPAQTANAETPIQVSVNGVVLNAVLYDTPEANQFKALLPITISMWNYGGREVYGGLDSDIAPQSAGQLYFADGDITYCDLNNTVAIFYAQTDRPNLTMEVIPMGCITSDLSTFLQLNGDAEITFALAE